MKRYLSLLLCGIILALSTSSRSRADETPKVIGPTCFVIFVGLAAAGIIIYIMKTCEPSDWHRFVLEKSPDNKSWTPVATNTLRLPVNMKFKAFTDDQMCDACAFYRVRVVPLDFAPQIDPRSTARAIPQT